MSRMEYHKGRVLRLTEGLKETKIYAADTCRDFGVITDTPLDYLMFDSGHFDKDYMLIGTCVYKVLEHREVEDDHFEVVEEDGIISFQGGFYNGGGSLEEAIDNELNKINNDNKRTSS